MFQIRKIIFIAGSLSAGFISAVSVQAAIPTPTYCAACTAADNAAQFPLTTTAAQLIGSAQAAAARAQPSSGFPVPLTAAQMEAAGYDPTPFQMNPNWTAASNSASQASATFASSFYNGISGQVNMSNLCSFWAASIPDYSGAFTSCAAGADSTGLSTTAAQAYAPLFPNTVPTDPTASTYVDTNISLKI